MLFSCFLSIASSHDAQQPAHQLAERLARVPQAHREELGGGALRARGVERVRHPRRLQPERREVVRPEGEAAQLAETLHEHLERRVDLRDWGEIGVRWWREIAEAMRDQIYAFFLFIYLDWRDIVEGDCGGDEGSDLFCFFSISEVGRCVQVMSDSHLKRRTCIKSHTCIYT